ncbi:ABC transporter ATP-binding protein [Limobrevibacterium gyesilva]|uniref:ABC transporter ATP-binding protein n=1 Tax=Limobrevibacterium gyesilva TaxID=2991712 RepID=UPI0022268D83
MTDLRVHYPIRKGVFRRQVGAVRAVDGVSFGIAEGETFGLVGESGCGKSTLARAILRLQQPTGGTVQFRHRDGGEIDVTSLPAPAMRALRRDIQIVFQDPYSSLNPRLSIGMTLAEPVRAIEGVGSRERRARVAEALAAVGLPMEAARRFPHEFSGGQRQRIAIARALITRPRFVVLDEPVSALDVSIRAQVLNLLVDMQRERALTYLFVSHDLSVVRYLCNRVAVMYLGRIVELGEVDRMFAAPRHPYTRSLLAAIPRPQPRKIRPPLGVVGEPPGPLSVAGGCAFRSRCPHATGHCAAEPPVLRDLGNGDLVACHHAETLPATPRFVAA